MTIIDLTRKDIVELMEDEGYNITERTLRYWEQSGKMDKATRNGRYTYHSHDVLNVVRILCATRPQRIQKIRSSISTDSIGKIVDIEESDNGLIVTIRKGKSVHE